MLSNGWQKIAKPARSPEVSRPISPVAIGRRDSGRFSVKFGKCVYSSRVTLLRSDLTLPRFFLPSTRRRLLARVGRVATLRFGRSSDANISLARRARARSRFRDWLLVSSQWIRMAPSLVHLRPESCLSLFLEWAGRFGERSASNRSSTAVETLLTFCPPGPEARVNCSLNSQSSIVMVSLIFNIALRRRSPCRLVNWAPIDFKDFDKPSKKGRRITDSPSRFSEMGPVRARPNQ